MSSVESMCGGGGSAVERDGKGGCPADYVHPPSTTICWLVIAPASSDDRKTTGRAMSSGVILRFRHWLRISVSSRRQPQVDLPFGHDPAGDDAIDPDVL